MIMELHKLTTTAVINPSEFERYIDVLDSLEVVYHGYGKPFVIPDYPCFMEYENNWKSGRIGFTRNTHKHPVLKEMIDKIVEIYSSIFPAQLNVYAERVHIIRTIGNVPIHRDEDSRATCINLGLKNSSGSTTYISSDDKYENFHETRQGLKLEDGHLYLMNTDRWHSIESSSNEPRYLVTYAFGRPYIDMKPLFSIE